MGGTDTQVDMPKPKLTGLLVVALHPLKVLVGVERCCIQHNYEGLREKKGGDEVVNWVG